MESRASPPGRTSNPQAGWAALDRSRLPSRSCAAVKEQPQVLHLQLVNALLTRLGPSVFVWGWFTRTARTSSPPHSEHSRFCIARPDTENLRR